MKPYLSKTQFLRGLQCHKALWLLKNRSDLVPGPSDALLAIFEEGHEVGELAQGLFPGGEEIEYLDDKEKMIGKTADIIRNGARTIYEATFRFDNILVIADILHHGPKGWEIYEVKSGTSVKEINIWDVALQYYVIREAGLDIRGASLVHIDNTYERRGDLDIRRLFAIEDMTEEVVARRDAVRDEIEAMRRDLGPEGPAVDIGPHCKDPFECDFKPHCWAHVPETSIFDINRLGARKKFDLYYRGMVKFSDLPEDYPLSERQRMQVDAELDDRDYVNVDKIREFLRGLRYPRYYLDFETFQMAIPPFDAVRPYEHVPFQFSLHVVEGEGAPLLHHEFLAEPGPDPRKEIARRLTALIPPEATVIAYNANFEKMILRGLAERFPEYRERLEEIISNMVDLAMPFRLGYCYRKEMKGSASLKAVLPALVPELGYDGMAIGGGQEASAAYGMLRRTDDEAEKARIKKSLLEYCKLDTLAMVRLVEVLEGLCKGTGQ